MLRYRDVAGDGGSQIAVQLDTFGKRLEMRMAQIRHVLLVMSGKGGVGKSSVAVNVAAGFAKLGHQVGLLDGDIYGPSVPKMFGIQRPELVWDPDGVQPPKGPEGIPLMSLEFLLKDEATPIDWDGPREEAFTYRGNLECHALREMLADTVWGALDLLVIDLPPGTNQAATLCHLLPKLDGVVVVSIPTKVSGLVVDRAIALLGEVLQAPVLGVVENMCGYFHVETGAVLPLFAPCNNTYRGTSVLGHLPFDHRMASACDQGIPFVSKYPDSPVAEAMFSICQQLSSVVFSPREV